MEKKHSYFLLSVLVVAISLVVGEGLYTLTGNNLPTSNTANLVSVNQNPTATVSSHAATNNSTNKTSTKTVPISVPISSGLNVYRDPSYGFRFQYSTSIFKLFPQTDKPPVVFHSTDNGVKIISADRAGLLNTEKCIYGKTSMTQTCTLTNESGISFVVANAGILAVINPYVGSLAGTTVAKKQGYIYYAGTNVTGVSSDIYFIPINSTHTLVITRTYRSDGFPSPTQFNGVISTLEIN